MTDDGYCTPEDVRKVLQENLLSGEINPDIVRASILGQTEWVQERTHRHWFEASEASTEEVLAASPRTHFEDVLSIPSSAHAQHSQLPHRRERRYPRQMSGSYTRVRLTRRDVVDVTELLIGSSGGAFVDWTSKRTEGRGEDYYLQVDASTGATDLYLDTRSLAPLRNYDDAVIATYDYGIDGVPHTVRRGVALRSAAQLVLDDDAEVGIPDSGQLVSLESKAQAMERQADELLSIHLTTTPIA
ncbi:hypothetical protein [Halomarina rubra]|uniref:Uncharacterized protein n=1 Tax=Halomarina rubra TaxID=2071873 RepID=A0ABD6AU50_9EURY|nr:hypothetical protein [Halomarina rubra]